MALIIADRVRETSATTGTGTLTLDGAVSGYRTFSSAIGDGNTCYYTITLGSDWEVGLGTVSAGQLARTTILESSNANSAVNFGAGTKDVFATYPGDKAVVTDNAHTFTEAQTFRASNAIRSEAAATQDAVVVAGRAGGTASYAVTLTPTTLSANRTLTLPNATDTVATIGTAQTFTAAQTFRAASAIRSEAASTQDAVVIAGRAGGTGSWASTITPTTLTANRTVTLPNASGTIPYVNASNTWTGLSNTFSNTIICNGGATFANGNVNIDSSITLNTANTHLIIGAATSNFGNIQLLQGVLPTTITIGSIEYQSTTVSSQPDAGGVMYFTPAPSSRAAVVSEHFAIRTGTKTMTSNTSLQSIFAGGTNGLTSGALTLPGKTTYFFECSLNLSSMSSTSGNLGFSIVGAGTATFNSAAWHAIGLDATTQTTAAALGGMWSSANAQTGNIVTAATGTACSVLVKGIFSINAGGTIIPSIQLTTAAAAVIGVNTWFKCYPVGVGDVSTIGNWA